MRSAVSAYFVYQCGNGIDGCLRSNAVAEIEHVSRRRAERIEHAPRRFTHALLWREQR